MKGLAKDDLKKIETTVSNAESNITGEIVPVLLSRSHTYPASKYKYALLFAFTAFVVLVLLDRLVPAFQIYDPLLYFALVFGGAILGYFLPLLFPSLSVLITSPAEKEFATFQKAETIFLEHEIFNTKHRTGILLFISFAERQALIMADKGIDDKVQQEEWDQVVDKLLVGVSEKRITEGIIKAIEDCSSILIKHGFISDEADQNELSNQLISDT
ncbi:TPM domain-containing protein [Fulvivirga aurantia]|uniref:TPM domain-containing protein n=1 Tax=Fulvivirga aurantia TaxID=2529383 RepID=UPI001628623E|nr:TPM domain-containing protein [Fulvivirga aurantia]